MLWDLAFQCVHLVEPVAFMLLVELTFTEPLAYVLCSKNWRSSMQFSGSAISEAPKGMKGQQHQLLCRVWEASRLEALRFAQDLVHRRIW